MISEDDTYTADMIKDDEWAGFELEDVPLDTQDTVFSFNDITIDLQHLATGNYYGDNGTVKQGVEDQELDLTQIQKIMNQKTAIAAKVPQKTPNQIPPLSGQL